jgi:hypothetical protein
LEDVLALEAELTRRQADLESVDAQRAALADLASLATVTVRLTTPEDAEIPGPELPPFLQGLEAGWEALLASTDVVLVVLGALLPFAAAGAVVVGSLVLALRLLRGRRAPAGRPAAVPPGAAPGPQGPVPDRCTAGGPAGPARRAARTAVAVPEAAGCTPHPVPLRPVRCSVG